MAAGQHFRDFLGILRRWRVTVLLCFVLTVGTAAFGLLRADRVYTATATLHIEPESPSVVDFDDVPRLRAEDRDSFYQTQYGLIRSYSLASRVVHEQRLFEEAEFAELFAEPTGFAAVISGLRSGVRSLINRASDLVAGEATFDGDADAEVSAERRTDIVVRNFLSRVDVSPLVGTRLVEVSWRCGDPELAARVTNALAETYIEMDLQAKYEANARASEFLASEISRLETEITEARSTLQNAGADVLSLDERRDTTSRTIVDINADYTRAQTDRIQKRAALDQLSDSDPSEVPEVLNNELVQQLEQDYADLQQRYRLMSEQFTDGWPAMQRLRSQMVELRDNIEQEKQEVYNALLSSAQQAHQAAVNRESSLQALLQERQSGALEQNRNLAQIRQRQTEIENKEQVLQRLLERQNQTGVRARLQGEHTSNIRIVDVARAPFGPSSPRPRLILPLAVMYGLFLGISLAVFQDYMDNSLKSPEDAERRLGLPVLGTIPSLASVVKGGYGSGYGYYSGDVDRNATPETLTAEYPRSSIAEAFRTLRSSIMLSKAGEPPRVLLVTSAQESEGKTLVSANLAICFAQTGMRVLLVDADMRRPRQHEIFQTSNERGLVNYFVGYQLLHTEDTGVDNLSLIPSGPTPPNPSELLLGEHTGQFFKEVLGGYDLIVVDSPPVIPAVDALHIGPQTDGVLLVVRGRKTPSPAVKRAADKLQECNSKMLGVVLNNMPLAGNVGYYFGIGSRRGFRERLRGRDRPPDEEPEIASEPAVAPATVPKD